MAFTDNLIDFNTYTNDFTDLDAESPDNQLKITDCLENNWPDKQDNFDASPILDSGVWVGLNSDQGGVTRLVSSEEDLISESDCNIPVLACTNVNANTDVGDNFMDATLKVNRSSDNRTQYNNSKSDPHKSLQPANSLDKKKETVISLGENDCTSCHGRVYITERLVFDKLLYHKQCFKCAKCRRILSLNNFASNCGLLFCKPHFLEMFRQTGKYDEIDSVPKEISNHNAPNPGTTNNTGEMAGENTQADELPAPQITRNIVEKFRRLESTAGIESLLPRQLSSGQQNMKSYQSTNVQRDSVHVDDEATDDVNYELPTPGITRNLLSLWSNMESKSLISSAKSASSTSGTPKKTNKDVPLHFVDIVRHDDLVADSYPAPNTTKSLAAKFKGEAPVIQDQSNYNSRRSSFNRKMNPQSHNRPVDIVSSSTQNDDWLQSRVSNPSQGSENDPIPRHDVLRSESKTEIDELPEQGITQNLIGLFRSMEAKK